MSDPFDDAMVKAFGSEGGLSDHPADRGGLTNYGLSLRYLRNLGADRGGDIDMDGDVDVQDVLAARPADARRLFRRDFWIPSGAEDIATVAPLVASETFDFAVVRGPGNAARAVQRALCDLGFPVDVDGIYGDETHAEVLRCVDGGYGPGLLQAVRRRQCEQFVRIVENDRSQIVFLLGWIRRALDLDA